MAVGDMTESSANDSVQIGPTPYWRIIATDTEVTLLPSSALRQMSKAAVWVLVVVGMFVAAVLIWDRSLWWSVPLTLLIGAICVLVIAFFQRIEEKKGPWLRYQVQSGRIELPRLGQAYMRPDVVSWQVHGRWYGHPPTSWVRELLVITKNDQGVESSHVILRSEAGINQLADELSRLTGIPRR
jgi:hypothetical protein